MIDDKPNTPVRNPTYLPRSDGEKRSATVMKAIPTYYMVEPLNGILNYGMGLSDYIASIIYLVLFIIGFFILGFVILKRRLV